MTSEKPSMPELIYYCEFDPEKWDERLEITFSNRHIVTAEFQGSENEEPQIHIDIQSKESAIPRDFFGKNILNVSAIIGKNGVGKTNIFKGVFYEKPFLGKNFIKIFKDIDKEFFYIEGGEEHKFECNRDIKVIESDVREGINNLLLFYNVFSNTSIHLNENNLFKKESHIIESQSSFYYLIKGPQSVSNQYVEMAKDFYNYFKINISDQQLHIEFSSVSRLKKIKKEYPDFYRWVLSYFDGYSNDKENLYDFLFNVILLEVYLNLERGSDREFRKKLMILTEEGFEETDESKVAYLNSCLNALFTFHLINVKENGLDSISFSDFFLKITAVFKSIPNHCKSIENRGLFIDFSNEPYNPNIFGLITNLEIIQKNLYEVESEDLINIVLGNYSSGERHLLNLASSVMERILNGEHYRDFDENPKTIILVIDEFDQNLHPEWARVFFQYLSIFLGRMGSIASNIVFQIILSSHSPYLISDLPKENIRLITKKETTRKRKVSIPKHGFASNYYDILSDSFFLEDTIGEFAKKKINKWIKELNDLKREKAKIFPNDKDSKIYVLEILKNDNSSEFFLGLDQVKLERIDKIKKLIMIVDDQFLRNKLLELADDIKNKIIKNADSSHRESLIDAEIAKLEAMREQLRAEKKND